jgi:hypothetical protein
MVSDRIRQAAGRCLNGFRHKGHNLSTGKTTSVLLFNTVLIGDKFLNNDPRRLLAVPPPTIHPALLAGPVVASAINGEAVQT